MRFAIDTGGTFTDLIVEDDAGGMQMFKASTTPADPILGVFNALSVAADARQCGLRELLGRGDTFIYGTTHALNAVITGHTACTAFLTTQGHPDVLTLREGGRAEPFNFTVPYPSPYVPRALTWELAGRLLADGSEREPLNEAAVVQTIAAMRQRGVQAVGVCLLWSIVNPAHELRVGELLAQHWPECAYTLSHQLSPTLREYRRASATCIDASLKPAMAGYLADLEQRLKQAGFGGRTLVVTSQGGVMDAAAAARQPIHLLNSGPAMAPVAGRYFAFADEQQDTAIIADTGGTTYDVSLVRRGRIPWTRESWIGQPYRGHMTGFPAVEVSSVGAGGGSIAWVDEGGMLRVGPQSAGAVPGPVCYGRGGHRPTVTDAALVLGYIDPHFFLGGNMTLDQVAARTCIETQVARPLALSPEEAALAIIQVATENMVQAIEEITVNQGVATAGAVLVGGGGAAGLNSVLIARRLESSRLLIPAVGAAMSAAGALMSELTSRFEVAMPMSSGAFDAPRANQVLSELERRCHDFMAGPGSGAVRSTIDLWVEARYPDQVWEIEVLLPVRRFTGTADVAALVEAFHAAHDGLFAIRDTNSGIEVITWGATVSCTIRDGVAGSLAPGQAPKGPDIRACYFAAIGTVNTQVLRFESLRVGEKIDGPAIIESPFTTVVVNPGAQTVRRASGSLSIDPGRDPETRSLA